MQQQQHYYSVKFGCLKGTKYHSIDKIDDLWLPINFFTQH